MKEKFVPFLFFASCLVTMLRPIYITMSAVLCFHKFYNKLCATFVLFVRPFRFSIKQLIYLELPYQKSYKIKEICLE